MEAILFSRNRVFLVRSKELASERKMGKKKTICQTRTISGVRLYRNGLGWVTLEFSLKTDRRSRITMWEFMHLNEKPQYRLLIGFLKIAESLGEDFNRKTKFNLHKSRFDEWNNMVSFDKGRTWYHMPELSDSYTRSEDGSYKKIIFDEMERQDALVPIMVLNNFIGKRVRFKGVDFLPEEKLDFCQNGAISLNGGKTWFDFTAKKERMIEKWNPDTNRMGVL